MTRVARRLRAARVAIPVGVMTLAARLVGCGDVTPYVVEKPHFDTGISDVAELDALPSDANVDTSSDAAGDVIHDGDGARDPDANCEKPGYPGNELGIGRYCEVAADCAFDGAMRICTAQFTDQPYEWFCTTICTDSSQCGSGALCGMTKMGVSICAPLACIPPDAALDGG